MMFRKQIFNLKKRKIQNLSKGVTDTDDQLCRLLYQYRKRFHLSHEDMLNEPIPTVMTNLSFIEEEEKEKRKAMKKRGKR